jgi:hypothetical protein
MRKLENVRKKKDWNYLLYIIDQQIIKILFNMCFIQLLKLFLKHKKEF